VVFNASPRTRSRSDGASRQIDQALVDAYLARRAGLSRRSRCRPCCGRKLPGRARGRVQSVGCASLRPRAGDRKSSAANMVAGRALKTARDEPFTARLSAPRQKDHAARHRLGQGGEDFQKRSTPRIQVRSVKASRQAPPYAPFTTSTLQQEPRKARAGAGDTHAHRAAAL